jgi:hypothetical protein
VNHTLHADGKGEEESSDDVVLQSTLEKLNSKRGIERVDYTYPMRHKWQERAYVIEPVP